MNLPNFGRDTAPDMDREYDRVDAALRAEADQLLESGLRDLLAEYGAVHAMGSYALRLMVWRDLDIELVPPDLERTKFFQLGARLADRLQPVRMSFRDETLACTEGLPRGLYWGVYLGDERRGAWKIDIWAVEAEHHQASWRALDALRNRLSQASREAILRIKTDVWSHPEYRRGFSSRDIYEAVLEQGVADVEGFWKHLERRARQAPCGTAWSAQAAGRLRQKS